MFINNQGLVKGAMTLIDIDEAKSLYSKFDKTIECSGGSAANTIAGLASLGGSGAFIGKVHNDHLGEVFRNDILTLGVAFESTPTLDGASTATSIILVTKDAERTMMTYLGACVDLGEEDVDENLIKSSQITYLEGYLWDRPSAKKALLKACKVAHQVDKKISLSLSDPFCVDRHRVEFRKLIEEHVDILFSNEEEILSLYETSDFNTAIDQVRGHCEIAAITRGKKGSIIINGDEVCHIEAERVAKPIDTTGAGDAYAAGFLYGVTNGQDLITSGRIGSICAAEVVSSMGARSNISLKELIGKKFTR